MIGIVISTLRQHESGWAQVYIGFAIRTTNIQPERSLRFSNVLDLSNPARPELFQVSLLNVVPSAIPNV
jgi:hypothetical protein